CGLLPLHCLDAAADNPCVELGSWNDTLDMVEKRSVSGVLEIPPRLFAYFTAPIADKLQCSALVFQRSCGPRRPSGVRRNDDAKLVLIDLVFDLGNGSHEVSEGVVAIFEGLDFGYSPPVRDLDIGDSN